MDSSLGPKDTKLHTCCHGDTGKPAIKAGLTGLGISCSSSPKQNELRVKAKRRHPSIFDMVVGGGGGGGGVLLVVGLTIL